MDTSQTSSGSTADTSTGKISIKDWHSLELRTKSDPSTLERFFVRKSDELSDKVVRTSITGKRSDDTALHDALGQERERETFIMDMANSPQLKGGVDEVVKRAIGGTSNALLAAGKTIDDILNAGREMEISSEVRSSGLVKFSIHSPAVERDGSSSVSTWTGLVKPLESFKLTDQLRAELTKGESVFRDATLERWFGKADFPDLTLQQREDKLQEMFPNRDKFWSAWAKRDWDEISNEVGAAFANDSSHALDETIEDKISRQTSEVGSMDKVYLEVTINPNIKRTRNSLDCCGWLSTDPLMDSESVSIQLQSKDGFFHKFYTKHLSDFVDLNDQRFAKDL
ncbi:hypothetical protein I203_106822 [Kwoniella mangroviensis CBS 8507]|uniref:uncharacterized protein n=1 Tax=Kwoniella mangroviensis CBS 8507 TaxID=1296122 RepID=UPI00080D3DFA|nr:uncharacterized protein I203_08517 [Kwoniella mangroviensis CBS 8507]OCF62407.1 hypothetical protein I203_08517 [Kwoniella mangroviensis CBS 8507]